MSRSAKRTITREFKLQIVHQLLTGEKRLAQVCREHALSETLVRRWKEQYETQGEHAWVAPAGVAPESDPLGALGADPQARITALEAALGRAHLENEFLRKAVAALAKKGAVRSATGGAAGATGTSASRRSEP